MWPTSQFAVSFCYVTFHDLDGGYSLRLLFMSKALYKQYVDTFSFVKVIQRKNIELLSNILDTYFQSLKNILRNKILKKWSSRS